jgi:calcium binding protein 39
MSFFAKAKRRGLPKKLRKALTEFQAPGGLRKWKDILTVVNDINESLNGDQFRGQSLSAVINTKLYRDDTVALLVSLLPGFDQQIVNAVSTMLQTTIREFPRESLPDYLMRNQDVLTQLVANLGNPAVSGVCHILFRACMKSRDLMVRLYDAGIVGSFIQNLSGNNFDKLAAAFATYEALLTSHPDVSSDKINAQWEIFQIQFKQLLSSPNYLVQLNFLPVLIKFITLPECRSLFLRYLTDVENLQLIMVLLKSNSRRVVAQAYSVFKLFVINPRRTDAISSALKKNKVKLCHFLKDLSLDDSEPDLEAEKRQVIDIIEGLK